MPRPILHCRVADRRSRVVLSLEAARANPMSPPVPESARRPGDPPPPATATIRTWRYSPYTVGGVAVPVCTSVVFIYSQR